MTASSDATGDEICAGGSVTLTGGGATTYTWDNGVTDGTAFSPTATTTYTVTGTDANSCENTETITVTVNAAPTVTANSDATGDEICAGGSVTLTGGGAATYTWDNSVTDGTAFSPTATTTYTVEGTDANGCKDTETITITVNAEPTAAITTSGIDLEYCEGTGGATLTATTVPGATYEWFKAPNTTTADGTGNPFTSAEVGDWTVKVIDGNTCQATSTAVTTVENQEVIVSSNLVCQKDDGSISSGTVYVIELTVTQGDVASIAADITTHITTTTTGGTTTTVTFTRVGATNVFRSSEIDEETKTTVNITDENGCNTETFTDLQTKCSCPAQVDTFVLTDPIICEEGTTTITVTYSGGTTDYEVALSQPISADQTASLQTGTTSFTVSEKGDYGISVTSNGDGGCTVTGASVNLAHHVVPTATIAGDASICNQTGVDTPLTITLVHGTAPFSGAILLDGAASSTITNEGTPYSPTVSAEGVYTLDATAPAITDANGCIGTVSGSATITHIDDVVATASTECNDGSPLGGVTLSDTEFQIVVTVTQGDLNSLSVSETTAFGVSFTETTPGSGVWFSGPIDENNTVNLHVTDVNDCNNGINLDNNNARCSCPGIATLSLNGTDQFCADGVTTTVLDVAITGVGPWTFDVMKDATPVESNVTVTPTGTPVTGTHTYTITGNATTDGGTYTLANFQDANGGVACLGEVRDPQTVTVHSLPEAVLTTANTTICDGEATILEVTFSNGKDNYLVDLYKDGNFVITLSGTDASPLTYSVNQAGIYTIQNVIDANTCAGTVTTGTVTVTISSSPTAIISGGGSVCEPTTDNYDVVINITGSTPSYSIIYTINGVDQAAVTSGSPYTITNPTQQGNYTIKSVTEVGGAACQAKPSDLAGSANVTKTPSAAVTIDSPTTSVCEGEKITFTATATNTNPTVYKWFIDGFGEVAQTTSPSISTLNLTSSSVVSVQVANNAACAGPDVESNKLSVNITELLEPKLNLIDVTVCGSDLPLNLIATEVNNKPISTVVWSKDGNTLSETSNQLEVTQSGTYEVVFISGGNCQSKPIDGRTISTIKVQSLSVDIDVSATDVEEGETVVLTADVEDGVGNIDYQWHGEEQKAIGTGNPYQYTAMETDNIYVIATDQSSGCVDTSATELVNVLLPIDVPNAFTPNGDGINDTWTIDGLDTYRNSSLKVYNRWGQLVYSNTGVYANDWNGTGKSGKDLPTGTYYYVITLNQNGKENVAGDVTIIR